MTGFNTTTSQIEIYTATGWADATPSSLPATVITSGTLPVGRGGTGGTTPAEARASLDAAQTAHVHALTDVTGLNTALAGKAALVHTHVASDITDQSNINSGRVNGVKIFVGSSTPTGAQAGDLWFN